MSFWQLAHAVRGFNAANGADAGKPKKLSASETERLSALIDTPPSWAKH